MHQKNKMEKLHVYKEVIELMKIGESLPSICKKLSIHKDRANKIINHYYYLTTLRHENGL